MTQTTSTKATDLRMGDKVTTFDGKLRTVTGLDVTPAAVRIRTGRSTHWMRAKHDATFQVAR